MHKLYMTIFTLQMFESLVSLYNQRCLARASQVTTTVSMYHISGKALKYQYVHFLLTGAHAL